MKLELFASDKKREFGTIRTRKVFALIPFYHDDTVRWLEWVTYQEIWTTGWFATSIDYPHWEFLNFVDEVDN